jgi:hypothetical protein
MSYEIVEKGEIEMQTFLLSEMVMNNRSLLDEDISIGLIKDYPLCHYLIYFNYWDYENRKIKDIWG